MEKEGKDAFFLNFNDEDFRIQHDSRYLFDINPEIFQELMNTHYYKVKSNVSPDVFNSFIKYFINRQVPIINSENFFEFQELSNEFEIMKNIIQIYSRIIKNTDNYSLLNENQTLKHKLNLLISKKQLKSKEYKEKIQILFQNSKIQQYLKSPTNKFQLLKACEEENPEILENLAKTEIKQLGFSFIINEEENTASLHHSNKVRGKVVIPISIKYKRKDFFVTKIHEKAFKESTDIKMIRFPEETKVTTIEKSAFSSNCIEKIVFPTNFFNFKTDIFCETPKLKEIEFNSKSSHFLFYENKFLMGKENQESEQFDVLLFARRDIVEVTIPSFVKRICSYAFCQCRKIGKIEFESNSQLKVIERYAFYKSKIKSISIPSSVERICECAFSECYDLKTVIIEKDSKLKSIGDKAFSFTGLQGIRIPPNIVRINCGTFTNCRDLLAVDFSMTVNLKSIGARSFCGTCLKGVTFPSNLVHIGKKAFGLCSFLRFVEIPRDSELLVIEKDAFHMSKIVSIFIPPKILNLHEGFFAGTECLINIIMMPNNNRFLYYQNDLLLGKSDSKSDVFDILIFARRDIKKVTILPSIKKIAAYAFDNCRKIQKVDFSQCTNLCSIGQNAFNFSSLKNITIPSKVSRIEKKTFSLCRSIQKVAFSVDSQISSIEKKAFALSSLKRIVIPSTVTKICSRCFSGCLGLKNVDFEKDSKLTLIEHNAFSNTFINSLSIPDNVTEIGQYVFYKCIFFVKICFSEKSKLRRIKKQAFAFSSLKSISIPQHVTTIDELAFFKCGELIIFEIHENSELSSLDFDSIFGDRIESSEFILSIPTKMRPLYR